MKKKYTNPKSQAIRYYMENDVANIAVYSGQNTPKIDSNSDILSDKKQDPIWGEQNTDMWDQMSD